MNEIEEFWNRKTMVKNLFQNVNDSRQWNIEKRINAYPFFKKYMGVFDSHEGEIVMDYGCGPANDIIWLAEEGKSKMIIGFDTSHKALSQARHRINLHGFKNVELYHIRDDNPVLPLDNNTIDFINCGGVLHHTSHPEKIIKEFYRVLKPNKTSRIMVYNRDSLFFHVFVSYEKRFMSKKFKDLFGKMTPEEAFSKSTDSTECPKSIAYRPSDFVKICKNAGFSVEFVGGYFTGKEIKSYGKYGNISINDERLENESRSFIKEVKLDSENYPIYRNKHCGIGGSYLLKK